MKKLLLLILIGFYQQIVAQNPITILAPNYISTTIGFIPLPQGPGIDDYHGEKAECASNAMCDAQGQLKFFVVDNKIYDREGYYIASMDGASSNFTYGRSEITVVKDPANCERFYLFSIARNYSNVNAGDEYIKVTLDFTLSSDINPSRMGDAETDIIPGFSARSGNGNAHWAASKLRSDISHLVFFSEKDKLHIYSLGEVNPGITSFSSFNSIETPIPGDESSVVRAELEVNETHVGLREYRVAMPFYSNSSFTGGPSECIMVVDLDNLGNEIVGSKRLFVFPFQTVNNVHVPFIHGLEFDETGNYLFVSHTAGNNYTTGLSYVDLSVPGNTLVTPLNLPGNLAYQHSQIETLVINGVKGLYMATEHSMGRLDVDYATSSIQLQNNVLSFGVAPSYMTLDGLPNWSNYLDFKTYLLPDQVDGFDYLEFYVNTSSNLNCCKENTAFSKNSYTFTSSGTYSNTTLNPVSNTITNTLTIRDELRVAKGSSVTLKNMNIFFAQGAKLIIEEGDGTLNGGRLVLDNTKLTVDTRCSGNAVWEGVEVWGRSHLSQGSLYGNSQQGRLVIQNNSIIEHAKRAVVVGAFNASTGTYVSTKSGGICAANQSKFLNNQRDIVWWYYVAPTNVNNISYAINCEFLTTQPLNSGLMPINHIELRSVKGVTISGCSFIQSAANLMRVGNGIFATNSSFYVTARCTSGTAPCTGYDPNVFQNLRNGIYINNSTSGLTFEVDRNEFIDNFYGIWANSTYLASITRNKFRVFESNNQVDKTTGVRLSNSTKYIIEENYFGILGLTPNPLAKTYGIVISNSGPEANLIYKNNFEKLYVGGQSESNNSNTQTGHATGLVWKCNNFKNPMKGYDLAVVDGTIAYNQGYMDPSNSTSALQKAANNEFSQTGENAGLQHDFVLTNAQPINYVYTTSSTTIPDSYTTNLMTIQQSQVGGNPVTYNSIIGCPSLLGKGKTILKQDFLSFKYKLDNNHDLIESGSNVLLQGILETGNANEKKNALLAASPYVCDNFLIQYLNSNPSAGNLQQVYVANSPLTTLVLEALDLSLVPTEIKTSIMEAQRGISPRKLVEDDILYLNELITRNIDDQLREVIFDTTSTRDFSDVKTILESRSEKIYQEMLLNVYLIEKRWSEAETQLHSIGEYENTDVLNQIRIEMGSISPSTYLSSNESAVNLLEELQNDEQFSITAFRASSLLSELYGYNFKDEILDITFDKSIHTWNDSEATERYKKSNQLILYPNPTEDYIIINNKGLTGKIIITSLQGQIIEEFTTTPESTVLDLVRIKSGVYIIELVDDKSNRVYMNHLVKK